MKIEPARIKSWVERVERLLEERAAINGDIKDIYLEVKKADHDAKAIRKLIQRRAADPTELSKQDDLLAAYADAIAGKIKAADALAAGASVREAAVIGGIATGSAAALARSVQKSRKLNAPLEEDARQGEELRAGLVAGCPAHFSVEGGPHPRAHVAPPQPEEPTTPSPAKEAQPTGEPDHPNLTSYIDSIADFDAVSGPIPSKLRRMRA